MLRKALSRSVHCLSCGSKFHRIQYGPGFQNPTKNPNYPSLSKAEEANFQELVKSLSLEQQRAVGLKSLDIPIHEQPARLMKEEFKKRSKKERELLQCRWCLDAMQGRETPVLPSGIDVMAEIPSGYQLVHVIDAMDFPMTVCKDLVLKYGPRVVFVINRCDLVLDHQNKMGKFKEYVMKEVFDDMKVDAKNVYLVSATKKWNLQKFAECLKDTNAFVGKTGSGKSALATALSSSLLPKPQWELPFTTQRPVEYKTTPEFRSKIILDTPSLPEAENKGAGVYGLIRPKYLRKMLGGTHMTKLGNKYAKQAVVAKPGQAISIGGMIGLELPRTAAGQAVHTWPIIGGFNPILGRKVASIAKIQELNNSKVPQHNEWNMLNRENPVTNEPLEYKLDIPVPINRDEHGTSLVVRGVGVIQPRLYGNLKEPYTLKAYAIPGLQLGTRTELLSFLRQ